MNEWDIIIKALRDHGRIMIFGMIIGLIGAFLTITFQKPVYEARMIVAPTERTGVPSLGSILPQGAAETPVLQYFVSRIDAANSSDFTVFETLINSPRLASHLIEKNISILPTHNIPDLTLWMKKNVRMRPVGTTPFREVTLRHTNPDIALQILGTLFQETDMIIRKDTNLKTKRRMTYLKDQLSKTNHMDHKDAIIALLKEQEQISMMVSIDHHFAATPIEPPSITPKIVSPNWKILFPALGLGGAIIGFMLGGLYAAIRRS
ncbi:MAG: hypothetical protein COB76_04375 [Alphaproteobacteria bacterium]|nr:MAG: hypothetical protein COB76_04375 [Alphaproteobacteria bacterium]